MTARAARGTPAAEVGKQRVRRAHRRQVLAIPAGAVTMLVAFGLLTGAGYLIGVIAFTGAPGSTLLRRGLVWSGPAALLAAATGGYVAAYLAGLGVRAAATIGLAAVLVGLAVVVAVGDIMAGDAVDFHSLSIAMGLDEPARPPEGAIPANVEESMPADANVAEPSEIAMRRTRRSLGWVGVFVVALLSAGATGGWARTIHAGGRRAGPGGQ